RRSLLLRRRWKLPSCRLVLCRRTTEKHLKEALSTGLRCPKAEYGNGSQRQQKVLRSERLHRSPAPVKRPVPFRQRARSRHRDGGCTVRTYRFIPIPLSFSEARQLPVTGLSLPHRCAAQMAKQVRGKMRAAISVPAQQKGALTAPFR